MYPYPDENTWWAQFEADVDAIYVEAGQLYPNSPAALRWHSRTAYDIAAGLSPEASKQKHLAELRAALGLNPPTPVPTPGDVLQLQINGQFFRTHNGPEVIIGCSDFLLFDKYCHGQDITPILMDRISLGFNQLRVLTTYKGTLGDFDGRQFSIFLPEFCSLLSSYGLRVELTAWADTQRIETSNLRQLEWVHEIDSLVGSFPNVFIEGVNEDLIHDNSAPGLRVPTPVLSICSHGASKEQGNGTPSYNWGTAQPVWRYATVHPPRDSEWCRKVGHNSWEVAEAYDVPVVANETCRPDQAGFRASEFFDAAAGASLFIAGATYHSVAGRESVIFGDQERACAVAWVSGARAVPLSYRGKEYANAPSSRAPIEHRDEWSIATHSMIDGNKACSVVSKRNSSWQLVTKGGWQVVSQNESVILLER